MRTPTPHHFFRRVHVGEALAGLILAAAGVSMVVATGDITVVGNNQVGPRFFPYLVGGLLLLTGVGIAVSAARGHQGESEAGEDVDASKHTDWKTLGFIIAIFLAYIFLIQPVGYLLMTIFLFGGMAWILGARRWRGLITVSVVVPFLSYLFFTRVLGIYIPNGILEAVI
ncbi:tripartite tricarboxylate transporter TctB family protein [Arthrobacter castelli]|uniref:tripartite tricarboxylate transporter TctB family protein n=1 Tax=Arthrobacter castelli TaxID=271431 RepID=UPI0004032BC3|nr:tripartite tricarboxylate transporter TctB family protein [Arthrobacter castelli]